MSFQGHLGHDCTIALVHVIENGHPISAGQVGTTGVRRGTSDTFWLDGEAAKPA